jgi:protein TonB
MPRDLFGDVVVRQAAVRARRSPVLLISIAAHAIVLLAVIVGSILAPDMLPMPRQALAFYEPVRVLDIQLPPPPKSRDAAAPQPALPPVSANAAPVVAPGAITPETGLEGAMATVSVPVVGIENGIGSPGVLGVPEAPPPPLPTAPAPPRRLHSGMTAPRKVFDAAPKYPELARAAHQQGIVILEATIDASGRVESTHVLRSIPLLDEAALEAVRQWRFTPALLNGVPIPIVMTVTVRFTLQ